MSIIQSIRQYFYRSSLNKKLSTNKKSTGKKITFDNAGTIGLLFDANDLNTRNIVLNYSNSLKKQGKKVRLLGFFENKHETGDFTFDYYNLKNIDWASRTKGESVETFINEPFDILIAPMLQTNRHTEYIAALSRARLKAGPIASYAPAAFDVMVDFKQGTDLPDFIRQIETLLRKTESSAVAMV
ncbi:MAG: hypothetical protein KDC85_12845 [Saprospiraceae bacterium]|nr:hypothetical protein [Saprospiraceae bacterium]MCB9323981.1 hypothetical protein [Lewinellaceae bacterium]